MENLSRVFQKVKRKKKQMKRLSFILQFKIECLLPFTSQRKVIGKMPDTRNFFRDSSMVFYMKKSNIFEDFH